MKLQKSEVLFLIQQLIYQNEYLLQVKINCEAYINGEFSDEIKDRAQTQIIVCQEESAKLLNLVEKFEDEL